MPERAAEIILSSDRINRRSLGHFDPDTWVQEGDGLLASARLTRAAWHVKRRRFRRMVASGGRPTPQAWHELVGLPRSSLLLLAYSVEMYLKACLAKAYIGCREGMFERDVKRLFGHDYAALATEIAFPGIANAHADLNDLSELVLTGARYPIRPPVGRAYTDEANERTMRTWDRQRFARFCKLAIAIREYSTMVDADRHDPASHHSYAVDSDGYLAFRVGGRLPPRITYRISSQQRTSSQTAASDMRELARHAKLDLIEHWWDRAEIREDTEKKTIVRQSPT